VKEDHLFDLGLLELRPPADEGSKMEVANWTAGEAAELKVGDPGLCRNADFPAFNGVQPSRLYARAAAQAIGHGELSSTMWRAQTLVPEIDAPRLRLEPVDDGNGHSDEDLAREHSLSSIAHVRRPEFAGH
jgi:hypothetical protein